MSKVSLVTVVLLIVAVAVFVAIAVDGDQAAAYANGWAGGCGTCHGGNVTKVAPAAHNVAAHQVFWTTCTKCHALVPGDSPAVTTCGGCHGGVLVIAVSPGHSGSGCAAAGCHAATTTTRATTTTQATTTTTTTEPVETPLFTDVPLQHPYYHAIQTMGEAGMLSGYAQPGGTSVFRPDGTLLRAQFAKLVCGAFVVGVDEALVSRFTDMGPDDPQNLYPHDYVETAALRNIVRGVTASAFEPYLPVTRAQMVTMMVRAAENLHPGELATPPIGHQGTFGDFSPNHQENMRIAEYNGLPRASWALGRHGTLGMRPPGARRLWSW